MKIKYIVIILLCFTGITKAQDSLWITLEKGAALYLSPLNSEWIPIVAKEKIPVKTFILIKDRSIASIFKKTDQFILPSNSYIFIDDMFKHAKNEIVIALAQIEAEQLPNYNRKKNHDKKKPVGLIFGNEIQRKTNNSYIPHEYERMNAVDWFIESKQYSAALLTLKRMISKYPHAYLNKTYSNRLFTLYEMLKLYGYLLEETRLLENIEDTELHQIVIKWQDIATQKLTKQ